MNARTHLSIGEVLSLLTDDFPDLTITKIRFLESQGLIDPERTASGYRKFYDSDIERLRWILRQQRENFLPLKVIKDRLDQSEGKRADDAKTTPAQAELDLARDPGNSDPPPVWMADHAAAHTTSQDTVSDPKVGPGHTSDKPAGSDDSPHNNPPHDNPGNDGRRHEPATEGAGARPSAAAESGIASRETDAASRGPQTAQSGTSGKGDRSQVKAKAKPKAKSKAKSRPSTPEPASPHRSQAPKTEAKPTMSTSKTSGTVSSDPSPDVSDVSLTRAELLGAAALDERQLAQLESFGIVVPSDGPDVSLYGAEALICARQAATFLELGMEPRHLRAFKVAADREAGLYEQLILPLLRQRNPASRSEATELVGRLTAAGASIHAALLQQSLRSQLRQRP